MKKGRCVKDTAPLSFKIVQPPRYYFTTFTFTVVFKFSYLNLTLAFPVLFPAVIVNTALPFASVVALCGDTDTRFLPALFTFAVTIFPSSGGQPSDGIRVTTTPVLSCLSSSSWSGDADNDSVSHPRGVGVGVGVTAAVVVGVGVGATGLMSLVVV